MRLLAAALVVQREAGRRLAQEGLEVDGDVVEVERHGAGVGDDEVVGGEAPLGVEDAAQRAERHRQPVGAQRRVLLRPQRLDQGVARDGAPVARHEHLQQVARLARAPRRARDRRAVAQHAEAPERLDRPSGARDGLGIAGGHLRARAELAQARLGLAGDGRAALAGQARGERELRARLAERVAQLVPDRDGLLERRAARARRSRPPGPRARAPRPCARGRAARAPPPRPARPPARRRSRSPAASATWPTASSAAASPMPAP